MRKTMAQLKREEQRGKQRTDNGGEGHLVARSNHRDYNATCYAGDDVRNEPDETNLREH
jgi:hypothetical protein